MRRGVVSRSSAKADEIEEEGERARGSLEGRLDFELIGRACV